MDGYIAVTGGAAGLGRVVADALLRRGRSVVLVDHDDATAHATADDLGDQYGLDVPVIVADLATLAGIGAAADELIEGFEICGLVNNAGGWVPGDQYPDAEAPSWLSGLTLNLVAPMMLTQRLWPMLAAAAGAVVNIGSSGGVGDDPYGSPEYGAAKAGVRRFTTSLGARSDVRVTGVVPGWIGLDRARRAWDELSGDEQRDIGPLIPPEDVAEVVVSLLEHGRPGEIVEMLAARTTAGIEHL